MDAIPPGSTSHPLGEKLSRHDASRAEQRHRARSDRRIRRAKTYFTIIFIAGTLLGSFVLLAKGCPRVDQVAGATEGG
ncbi:MAG: hypothetical protein NTV51_25435 [Verrucomicrobia bacterium]|nr:hypothetical protein [Verrucomicrobiota bacterium]